MRQMTALDATFLSMELPNAPMHVGSLGIYTQKTAPGGGVSFENILREIENRAHSIPAMREKVKFLPMNMDHPYWQVDDDFDPKYHVRHISLPKPGTWEQLCEQVARIHARPLDRNRPLWEIYVIEGLDRLKGYPRGCFGLLAKIHHASIDGSSGGDLVPILHDPSAKPVRFNPKGATADAEQQRLSTLGMMLRAQANNFRYPAQYLRTVRDSIPKVGRTALGLARGKLKRIRKVPKSRFSGKVSADRVFDSVRFSLQDIKAIKQAVPGATINDVGLTLVGGALRAYLLDKDELPKHSLVAAAPVNLRAEGADSEGGNDVTNMSVALRTDIADPVERLQAINQGTIEAKAFTQSIGGRTLTNFVALVPAPMAAPAAQLSGKLAETGLINPIYNCSVTNVPGPRTPMYLQGAQMLINLGIGPVLDGVGIFNIINSYCEEFSISFTSCRKMIPDPEFYAQCIQNSYDDLYGALIS